MACDPCGSQTGEVMMAPSSDCGCDGGEVVSGMSDGATIIHEGNTHEGVKMQEYSESSSEQQQPTDAAPRDAFSDGFRSDQKSSNQQDPPHPPRDDWDAGLADEPGQPARPEASEPAEVPAGADEPMLEAEAAEAVIPDEPTADEPTDEPSDDLFEAVPPEEPTADEPSDEPSADVFEAVPPEESTADEPSDEPSDDLFEAVPPEESTESMPEDEPADDLFGSPAEAPADEPMEQSDEPAPEEDLFGAPADDAVPAESAPDDDLFGAPEEEAPAEETPADDSDDDDLFGPPAEEEAPADDADDDADDAAEDLFGASDDEEPATESAEDDLFGGFGAILGEPGGVESATNRTWIDNTGRHSTVGRMLEVDGAAIRLAKQDGSVATVPLGRLSQADLEFVSRQAIAQTQAHEWALAHEGAEQDDTPKQVRSKDKQPLRTAQL